MDGHFDLIEFRILLSLLFRAITWRRHSWRWVLCWNLICIYHWLSYWSPNLASDHSINRIHRSPNWMIKRLIQIFLLSVQSSAILFRQLLIYRRRPDCIIPFKFGLVISKLSWYNFRLNISDTSAQWTSVWSAEHEILFTGGGAMGLSSLRTQTVGI